MTTAICATVVTSWGVLGLVLAFKAARCREPMFLGLSLVCLICSGLGVALMGHFNCY